MKKSNKKKPPWRDIKRRLVKFDQTALLGLIQDLYAASRDNQAFMHARFNLGGDVLKPYKAAISRWICPDVPGNQTVSVAKAKKAISDYKKAVGHLEGLAELSVFYCETCVDFLNFCGMNDEGYFNSLKCMFKQALMAVSRLEADQQKPFVERLKDVQHEGHNWGWWVGDDMDALMAECGFGKD